MKAVFIFTKDRPKNLTLTLDSIKNLHLEKFIIDDSTIVDNQFTNKTVLAKNINTFYLGKSQLYNFIKDIKLDLNKHEFLLKPLGQRNWNLGYARNFALLYAKKLKFNKVLFIDDDISIPSLELMDELFGLIDDYDFVGANITGMIDDSILGHIATGLGIKDKRLLSGGFLMFNPNKIDTYFLNCYNEDWIWLYLQSREKKSIQVGNVIQSISNPFYNYKDRTIFQEYGEIIIEGLWELCQDESFEILKTCKFWERVFVKRENFLIMLKNLALKQSRLDYFEIIRWVINNQTKFSPNEHQSLFKNYFNNNYSFNSLFNSL